jgi:cell shape-determining protein MreC
MVTLLLRMVPKPLVEAPRTVLMDGVFFAGAPLYTITAAVLKGPRSIGWGGKSRADLEKEIQQLTAQLAAKESQLQKAKTQIQAHTRFNTFPLASLFLAQGGELMGRISGGDTNIFSRSYIVNLGRRHGVTKNSPVVWGTCAVGVISEAGDYCSRVRLLGDPAS